jgi:predicted dehydrogenase
MLEQKDLDLVVVATPHHLHLPNVIDSLQAGKHVFCEKPLAMNAAEADQMIATAKKVGRQLFAVQTQRSSPPFRRLKKIITETDMGRIVGGTIGYLGCEVVRMSDTSSWKGTLAQAGGGVLLDGGCHVIDLCNWYFGNPKSVMAQLHTPEGWNQKKGETTASVLIEYDNGAIAQVFVSFEARLPGSFSEATLKIGADIYFEEGSASAEYAYFGKYGPRTSVRYVARGDEEHNVQPTAEDGINYSQSVLDCLLRGAKPVVTPEEARQAVAVAECAYKSAKEGKRIMIPAFAK